MANNIKVPIFVHRDFYMFLIKMPRPKLKPIEYVNKIGNSLSVKISTNAVNELPEVVYVRVKLRITPVEKKYTYDKDITWITDRFEKFARNILDNIINYDNNQYLFNITVSNKSIKYGKNTHFHYDYFLKPLKQEEMKIHIERLKNTTDIINVMSLGN